MPTLQDLKLAECRECNRLRNEWYAQPGDITRLQVWEQRQACPVCRENMRKLTEYAAQAKMPEAA